MPAVASVVSAAGSIGGGIMGSNASTDAANTQAQSAVYATNQQRLAMQDAIQAQAYATMPGRNVGTLALYQLASMLGIDPRGAFPSGMPQGGGFGGTAPGGGMPGMTEEYNGPRINSLSDFGDELESLHDSAVVGSSPWANGRGSGDGKEAWETMLGATTGFTGLQNLFGGLREAFDGGSTVDFNSLGSGSSNGAGLIPSLPAPGAPGAEFGRLNRPYTMQDLVMDPSYGFRLNQNLGAIENSAAARGMQLSGSTLKDLSRFSQDYASQEYGAAYGRRRAEDTDLYNRFASLAGIGQTAAAQTGQTAANAAMNFGNQAGQNAIGMGNALAAGQIGSANSLNSGFQGASNTLQNYMLMQQLFNQSGGSTT